MYKILNKLFGWDYIYWWNFCDSGIARLNQSPDGTLWYYRYKNIKLIQTITDPKSVLWLTCTPDKYFPPNMEH